MITRYSLIVEPKTMHTSAPSKTTISSSSSSSFNETNVISQKRSKIEMKKTVQFGTITINEHPIIIGCNPAVSSGVPITIGWYSISQTIMTIQEYEMIRQPERVLYRTMLRQPSTERYAILQNLGFTRHELYEAEEAVNIIRELRYQSYLDIVDEGDNQHQYQLRLQKLYETSQLRKKQRRQRQRRQKQNTLPLITTPKFSTIMRRIKIF
jgi:hypothetical protein